MRVSRMYSRSRAEYQISEQLSYRQIYSDLTVVTLHPRLRPRTTMKGDDD